MMQLAGLIYPGLREKGFFTSVNNEERYYSGLIEAHPVRHFKSSYCRFDYAFSIHASYSLCDIKSAARWIRQSGNLHRYIFPSVRVIERVFIAGPPAAVSCKVAECNANVLIVDDYDGNFPGLKHELQKNNIMLFSRRGESVFRKPGSAATFFSARSARDNSDKREEPLIRTTDKVQFQKFLP